MSLPTYYIILSAVYCLLAGYVYQRADKKQYSGVTAMDLFLWTLFSGAVGARLFHVLYEAPRFYLNNPLEIFYFWQGGFVFYGGVLGGLLGGWITLQIKKQSFPLWLDFFTPVVSLGYALGRLACFFTGCCYGRVCDWPWAVPSTTIHAHTGLSSIIYRHPTQLYSVVLELLLFVFLIYKDKKPSPTASAGRLFALWLLLHSLSRFTIELFREDDRGSMWGVFSIAMLLSALFAFLATGYLLKSRSRQSAL